MNSQKQEVQEEKTLEQIEAEKELERKAKEKEEADWKTFVIKNSQSLSAGEFEVGQHLDSFIYDFSFEDSGNLTSYDNFSNLVTNEIGGSTNDHGISRYRIPLGEGFVINIKGMTVSPRPVKNLLMLYKK